MASTELLALDFDGVVSDSAPEAFVVALRTWCELHEGSTLAGRELLRGGPESPPLGLVLADPLYAPFLELMPLGNRAEDFAVELDVLERGSSIRDQPAYDAYKAGLDPAWLRVFHKRFYQLRHAMSEADPEGWQRLMGAYPGVPELLRRRAGDCVLAIATSKDRRSVGALLAVYGISDLFPESSVLDKEIGENKRAHLEHLRARTGIDFDEMAFVDDKVNHLHDVAALGVRCALAGWGYNGEREASLARAQGYEVLSLSDVEARLFGGG